MSLINTKLKTYLIKRYRILCSILCIAVLCFLYQKVIQNPLMNAEDRVVSHVFCHMYDKKIALIQKKYDLIYAQQEQVQVLYDKLISLEQEIIDLRTQTNTLYNLKSQNSDLKSLLNFVSDIGTAQQVVTLQRSELDRSHDKNSSIVNKTIINNLGLLGRIAPTQDGRTKLTLIQDKSSRISVVDGNGNLAVFVGNGSNSFLTHVRNIENVKVGDMWKTDGSSQYYVKNIPVAIVSKIEGEKIYAIPIASYYDLDFVSILLNNNDNNTN